MKKPETRKNISNEKEIFIQPKSFGFRNAYDIKNKDKEKIGVVKLLSFLWRPKGFSIFGNKNELILRVEDQKTKHNMGRFSSKPLISKIFDSRNKLLATMERHVVSFHLFFKKVKVIIRSPRGKKLFEISSKVIEGESVFVPDEIRLYDKKGDIIEKFEKSYWKTEIKLKLKRPFDMRIVLGAFLQFLCWTTP